MIAADDRLFAFTREGRIYCFAGQQTEPVAYSHTKWSPPALSAAVHAKAERILAATNAREGYAIVWGIGDGQLVEALVQHSDLHVIVVEPSARKVQNGRDRYALADLYGTRISLIKGDPQTVQLPPYLASVMVCENVDTLETGSENGFLARAYQSLRPFGGRMCFFTSVHTRLRLSSLAQLANAKVEFAPDLVIIVREGAIPGTANCTHENTDAANTRVSRDTLVKAPLGVLWFGGPSHELVLPRHGHGPQPQVIDGRMIIEGVDMMRAIDIYTGRLLWEISLPGVGAFYNNVAHQPGANASGSNFVSTSDGIYVAYDKICVRLDPATGKRMSEFELPRLNDMTEPGRRWGYINVIGDYLIGGADPLLAPALLAPEAKVGENTPASEPGRKKTSSISKLFKSLKGYGDEMSSSRHLVVMDRLFRQGSPVDRLREERLPPQRHLRRRRQALHDRSPVGRTVRPIQTRRQGAAVPGLPPCLRSGNRQGSLALR